LDRGRAFARLDARHRKALITPPMKRNVLVLALLVFPLTVDADTRERLRSALVHHASFDSGLRADYSRGDPVLYAYRSGAERVQGGIPAVPDESLAIVPGAGRHGGALRRVKHSPVQIFFKNAGILDYRATPWSRTISIWLRISPDEDLNPGYCDPVLIMGEGMKKGLIFMEWSRDDVPRAFRFAIMPRADLWNPSNAGWEEIPKSKRPMVELVQPIFSRERWTHAVFTLEGVNTGKPGRGALYLDGRKQGTIEGWDLTLDWTPEKVHLILGKDYVGYMDDLAVFDRALSDDEVTSLHRLPGGVGGLR